MKHITVENRPRQIPSSWDELGLPALRLFAETMVLRKKDFFTQDEDGEVRVRYIQPFQMLRLSMLAILLDMPVIPRRIAALIRRTGIYVPNFFLIPRDEIRRMIGPMDLLGFMFSSCELTRCPAPRLGKLQAPKDSFEDLNFEEWIHADRWANRFQTSGDLEHLKRMVAVLYRVKGVRPEDKDPLKNIKALKGVAPWRLALAYLWMMGVRSLMARKCPAVFTGSKGPVNPKAWNNLVFELSGKDLTRAQSVKHTPVWEILFWLDTSARVQKPQTASKT